MKRKQLLLLLALLMTAATGAWAQSTTTTYQVDLKDGSDNPTTWTGKFGDATTFSALPLEGVAKGQTVTLKYGGTREVKSITAKVEVIPEGAINGKFSVSATKKVYFSKGNLQYDGTNWKFAASQWEVLGANGTGANGTATNYPMDLFTWGNIDSPTYNGNTYYTENADLSGITDWGSRMGSGWYTLSKDEWLYLFGMESNNTDKSGHARYRKYFRATVNGVTGIVVLPDNLSGISDIPAESSRGTASNFDGKTYTTDAWSAMESAGCVFLPIAGLRGVNGGANVINVGIRGCYWSSTNNNDNHAYYVNFNTSEVSPQTVSNRVYGLSVRLVYDIE